MSDPLPFPLALPEPVWGRETFLAPAGTVIEPHEILAYSTVSLGFESWTRQLLLPTEVLVVFFTS